MIYKYKMTKKVQVGTYRDIGSVLQDYKSESNKNLKTVKNFTFSCY